MEDGGMCTVDGGQQVEGSRVRRGAWRAREIRSGF